jgi:tetratricopeptide (TPR) repeat protein
MQTKLRTLLWIGLLSIALQPLFADATVSQNTNTPLLGSISFPTSANHAAENDFIKGVLLLHNFDYDNARTFFQRAETADPNFALAYWGEAMTYNQPIWNEQELGPAQKVLDKLAPTDLQRVKKAKTKKEKSLINAINILYGKGDKAERDSAYADAMENLYLIYPKDDEIAAFYSLALLGKTEGIRNFKTYMQAAAIAEEVIQHNSKHPGALHYAIHAYDDPIHAPLGLRAAKVYAHVASASPHALHMPSHIFLALGLWDDVIESNKDAWAAGIKQNTSGNPNQYTIHDLHALLWLSYAYLQKKEYQQAYSTIKTMQKITESSKTPMTKYYYALARGAYITESGNWNTDLKSMDMTGMEADAYANNIYTNAMIALYKNKENTEINADITQLDTLAKMAPTPISTSQSIDYFIVTTPTQISIAKIITLELRAQVQLKQGQVAKAIETLQEATQIEDQLRVGYGPPNPIKPSHELLAEALFLDKQYVKAAKEYRTELNLAPNRIISTQSLKLTMSKISAGMN